MAETLPESARGARFFGKPKTCQTFFPFLWILGEKPDLENKLRLLCLCMVSHSFFFAFYAGISTGTHASSLPSYLPPLPSEKPTPKAPLYSSSPRSLRGKPLLPSSFFLSWFLSSSPCFPVPHYENRLPPPPPFFVGRVIKRLAPCSVVSPFLLLLPLPVCYYGSRITHVGWREKWTGGRRRSIATGIFYGRLPPNLFFFPSQNRIKLRS